MEERIEINRLSKRYGRKQALDGIQLSIGPGMFGLLGRNGAGKTTLMRILATLLAKTGGEITVCGIPISQSREIRQITGYLPQEFAIYPGMTVYEALDYLGVLSGLDGPTRKRRIPDLLERVNLAASRSKKVKTLSGGMNRRLGIAQAILHDPRVLIVDEPTAGLDPEERIRFRNLLAEIAQERIVLLSTHIVGDIEATCERIAVVDEGKLVYNGRTQELVETATGQIYTLAVSQPELASLKKTHLITSMVAQGDKTIVRFIATEPPAPEAVSSPPTIEDAYLLAMHRHGVAQARTSGGAHR